LYKLKARNTAELVNNAYRQRLIQWFCEIPIFRD